MLCYSGITVNVIDKEDINVRTYTSGCSKHPCVYLGKKIPRLEPRILPLTVFIENCVKMPVLHLDNYKENYRNFKANSHTHKFNSIDYVVRSQHTRIMVSLTDCKVYFRGVGLCSPQQEIFLG